MLIKWDMKLLTFGAVFINISFTATIWYFNRFTQWGVVHAVKNSLPLWILCLYPLYSQLRESLFEEKIWVGIIFVATFVGVPVLQMIHYPWTYYHFMIYVFLGIYLLKAYNRLHLPQKAWLLTALTILAYSETWEIPVQIHGWSWQLSNGSWVGLLFLASSGVPKLMALPIMLYLNGKPRLDAFRLLLLALAIIPTFYFALYVYSGQMLETHYRLFCALPYVAYPFLQSKRNQQDT